MKFIIAIILISIFPILTNAQYTKTVCVDTSIVNTYSFANIPLVPFGLVTLKNNYKLVITTSLQNTNGILQIASNGDIVWHKKFNSSFPNLFLRIDKILELKNGGIIIGGVIRNLNPTSYPTYVIFKVNLAGTILWQHCYRVLYQNVPDVTLNTITISSLIETENNEFVALFDDGSYGGRNNITSYTADGHIRWSKFYYGKFEFFPDINNGFYNGTINLMALNKSDDRGCRSLDNIHYKSIFAKIKINVNDGSILNYKSLCELPTDKFNGFWSNNYLKVKTTVNGNVTFVGTDFKNLLMCSIDSNGNFLKSRIYSLPNFQTSEPNGGQSTQYTFDISDNGSIAFNFQTYLGYPIDATLPYRPMIILDSNLEIKNELVFSAPISSNGGGILLNLFSDEKINYFDFIPATPSSNFIFPLITMPTSTKALAICNAIDTIIGNFRKNYKLFTNEEVITVDSVKQNQLQIFGSPLLVTQDVTAIKSVTCFNGSICDTIKLKGNTQFCSKVIYTFTAFKNRQCQLKVKWLLDTNFIKILSQVNDTTITVQFLQPYKGYIFATLDGCTLKDSLYIEVAAAKTEFSINKDSLLCPGKGLTLQASKGFANYHWQNGATIDNYNVVDTGFYKVIAKDSCGNTFSDSIRIQFVDTVFAMPQSATICNTDTFKLQVPFYFNKVLVQPINGASFFNGQLSFFPLQTTTYSISAETIEKCKKEKSILIQVNNCPANLYFPNAFSPNGIAPNNFFKPLATLPLKQYQLVIYNRYGQKVFESSSPLVGWDGKFNNIPQDIGTFIYYCRYQFFNKEATSQKGYCILLR